MTRQSFGPLPVLLLVAALGGLGLPAGAAAQEPARPGAQPPENPSRGSAEVVSEYVRDYLSDPRRVGTLTGSILGGALTAHPAGTVLGSVVGFFVGKTSMFDEDKARAQRQQVQQARRDIVPPTQLAAGVPMLSLSNPAPLTLAAEEAPPPGAPLMLPAAPSASPSAPPVMASAPAASLSREQVVALCSGGGVRALDPRLRTLCFYGQAH